MRDPLKGYLEQFCSSLSKGFFGRPRHGLPGLPRCYGVCLCHTVADHMVGHMLAPLYSVVQVQLVAQYLLCIP